MTLLSRVANNLYWMARYIERGENTARLINVNSHLLLDLPKHIKLGWEPIIDINSTRDEFSEHYDTINESNVIKYMVTDVNNPSSIISSLHMARENARTIRDIIPREAWEQINEYYLTAKQQAHLALKSQSRYEYLREVILKAQTINGLLAGTMTHDACYSFLRMGRNLERADMTTRIIDVRSASLIEATDEQSPFDNLQWMSVLKSLTAYQMYRREVRLKISRPDVLQFLFQEEKFPRALLHTLNEVEHCLSSLPRNNIAHQHIKKLQNLVVKAQPKKLKQNKLHMFIDDVQLELINIHNGINNTYF